MSEVKQVAPTADVTCRTCGIVLVVTKCYIKDCPQVEVRSGCPNCCRRCRRNAYAGMCNGPACTAFYETETNLKEPCCADAPACARNAEGYKTNPNCCGYKPIPVQAPLVDAASQSKVGVLGAIEAAAAAAEPGQVLSTVDVSPIDREIAALQQVGAQQQEAEALALEQRRKEAERLDGPATSRDVLYVARQLELLRQEMLRNNVVETQRPVLCNFPDAKQCVRELTATKVAVLKQKKHMPTTQLMGGQWWTVLRDTGASPIGWPKATPIIDFDVPGRGQLQVDFSTGVGLDGSSRHPTTLVALLKDAVAKKRSFIRYVVPYGQLAAALRLDPSIKKEQLYHVMFESIALRAWSARVPVGFVPVIKTAGKVYDFKTMTVREEDCEWHDPPADACFGSYGFAPRGREGKTDAEPFNFSFRSGGEDICNYPLFAQHLCANCIMPGLARWALTDPVKEFHTHTKPYAGKTDGSLIQTTLTAPDGYAPSTITYLFARRFPTMIGSVMPSPPINKYPSLPPTFVGSESEEERANLTKRFEDWSLLNPNIIALEQQQKSEHKTLGVVLNREAMVKEFTKLYETIKADRRLASLEKGLYIDLYPIGNSVADLCAILQQEEARRLDRVRPQRDPNYDAYFASPAWQGRFEFKFRQLKPKNDSL